MKITLVTNASATSGVGKPVGVLQGGMRAAGHDVHVLNLNSRTSAIEQDGAVVKKISALPLGKPAFWLTAGRHLELPSTGIVHFTNQTLAFLARRAPARAVITVWDLIEIRSPQIRFGGVVARILHRGIPNAAHIITHSEATAREVEEEYGIPRQRLTVVPPSLPSTLQYNPSLFDAEEGKRFLTDADLHERPPVVLYVGSEHRRKNVRRLIEAFARVQREVPEALFVKIGGAGVASGRQELLDTIRAHGLERHVRILNESNDTTLRFWYHAARVLVFPSLYEGFGFPPLEAMACGTPVVTSNRSSLPEVVGDAAVLVNPEDTNAIASAILRVLRDANLRQSLREKGLARAAQFTQERTIAATLAVYERVLKNLR
ncbi:MAG: group 1 glycosyl transferase [Parcubacteria group bacterium Gr01-1014_106]|nr:MAG: group 1 glycosyl transferase [Parcubacteria group bacterium Gr01-1014_106]